MAVRRGKPPLGTLRQKKRRERKVVKKLVQLKKNGEEPDMEALVKSLKPKVKKEKPVKEAPFPKYKPPKPPKPPKAPPKPLGKQTENSIAMRKYFSEEERKAKKADATLRDMRKISLYQREIGPFPLKIDWKRRLEAKSSFRAFCEIYLKETFSKPWSTDQLYAVSRVEHICTTGGKFAFTMPRGGGKTAICRGGTLWATLYGLKHFIFNIGATEPKATGTLGAVKTHLSYNPLLHQDFPELCWPIVCLQGTNRTASGQLFMGEPTYVRLGVDEIRYPTIIFPKEFSDHYREHDPSSVRHISHLNADIPSNSLVLLRCAGISASVRGEAETDPVTLEQPRPDLVLLDDVQKDSTADSPLMCEKMLRLVDGAVTGLAGPGQHIDLLMPCTVIREDDVADICTDPMRKPEYQGRKFKMVNSWPEGITDYEITNDSPAGQKWNEYAELRRTSLRDSGNWKAATEFYEHPDNRQAMDSGFEVSWKDRFDERTEVSAQQHAMNLRLQLGPMFLSEYQNIGRKLIDAAAMLITADQLIAKVISYDIRIPPPNTQHVVAHIDVQDEVLFYLVFACDSDFNGTFIDYGTFPDINTRFFTKQQINSWSLLTTQFFQDPANAHLRGKAIRTDKGKIRAPFEAKIYHALQRAVPTLLSRQYVRAGTPHKVLTIDRLTIDTRWGQASDTIKRYIRETNLKPVIPYYGQALPPTNKQLEEYELRDGWYFEHQQHPNVKEPKWVIRPNPDGTWYMMADVNRLKDFLFQRLATPLGATGCITLHNAPKDYHELFVHHICSSEFPEPVAARGIVKNQWTPREGIVYDNDWLDCAAGCMAGASSAGASLKTSDYQVITQTRRLSDIANRKRKQRTDNMKSQTDLIASLEARNR